MTDHGQDLLMGSKSPTSLTFGKTPGLVKGGKIIDGPTEYHVREYDPSGKPGALRYFDDGNPIKGVWIDLQTQERDPSNPDDQGVRRLYVDKPRLRYAIRDAILTTGARECERGGDLYVMWTGYEDAGTANPAHTYSAQYTRPASQLMAQTSMQSLPTQSETVARQGNWPASHPTTGQANPNPPVAQQLTQPQPPMTPAPAQATATSKVPVPAAVYFSMKNAGMDVSTFEPIPGA